ncbi:hypothetical protein [Nonomuraea sp. NPDC050310]|uniref:hypothetical protein n=1 Tax=Nonomuraea sp. NPDC050310 TaxID=3154935 RepID=UPI0033FEA3B7
MRQLLVFEERDDAEEAAETVAEWHPWLGIPKVVRETLAGEDDAEAAQWLVVVEDADDRLTREDLTRLDELAEQAGGWREQE